MENESFVVQINDKSDGAPKAEKGEPQGRPIEGRVVKLIPIAGKQSFTVFVRCFESKRLRVDDFPIRKDSSILLK